MIESASYRIWFLKEIAKLFKAAKRPEEVKNMDKSPLAILDENEPKDNYDGLFLFAGGDKYRVSRIIMKTEKGRLSFLR